MRKFGEVYRDHDGIAIMHIGTLVKTHRVQEADRDCHPGNNVMIVLDRGLYDPAGEDTEYWLVGKTGWVIGEWGEEVPEGVPE